MPKRLYLPAPHGIAFGAVGAFAVIEAPLSMTPLVLAVVVVLGLCVAVFCGREL